jgi:hypothetical protein
VRRLSVGHTAETFYRIVAAFGASGLTVTEDNLLGAPVRVNGKRSVDEVARRIERHLQPFFGGRRLANVTTADVRAYVVERQAQKEVVRRSDEIKRKDGSTLKVPEPTRTVEAISNAEINRELQILKRIDNLAVQSGKLLHKPHVPLLREDNTRTGFLEPEQFASVHAHLPAASGPSSSSHTSPAGASPRKYCGSNGGKSI